MGVPSEKNFKIYLRSTRQWVEVTEDYYREHIWYYDAFRKRQQYHGRCVCTRNMFWSCDGDCFNCPYHRDGDMLSLDNMISNDDGEICSHMEGFQDEGPSVESEYFMKDDMTKLLEHLYRLMPEAKEIGELRLQGYTDEEIAQKIGIRRPTFVKRLKSVRERLVRIYPDLL